MDLDVRRHARDTEHRPDDGGRAGHVALHRLDVARALDVVAAGVEGHALADEHDALPRLLLRLVDEVHDARRDRAPLPDREQCAHAHLFAALRAEHLDRKASAARELAHARRVALRMKRARGLVDEIARGNDRLGAQHRVAKRHPQIGGLRAGDHDALETRRLLERLLVLGEAVRAEHEPLEERTVVGAGQPGHRALRLGVLRRLGRRRRSELSLGHVEPALRAESGQDDQTLVSVDEHTRAELRAETPALGRRHHAPAHRRRKTSRPLLAFVNEEQQRVALQLEDVFGRHLNLGQHRSVISLPSRVPFLHLDEGPRDLRAMRVARRGPLPREARNTEGC